MLDQPDPRNAKAKSGGPPLDFQEHLARLEAAGLLLRIDRAINKDTELHPLVRWQFQGGLREDERRAFLFTNVVNGEGRRYEVPVAIGALAASAQIYAVGVGRPVEEIGDAWMQAIANPIAPTVVSSAPCQEVVIKGDALRKPDGGLKALPVPISTPGYDAAPYLTATLCITQDPETGIRNMGTYRAGLKATDRLGVRMAARPGGAGGYLHWQKYRKLKKPMPIAIVIGAAPAEAADRLRRDGGGGRARRRADPCGESRDRRSRRAVRRRIRHRGADRPRTARAGGPVRRKPRSGRARRLQYVDAGDRDHA
jgi:4-hydroxy-3-polyprenylbenzoate decarboxylase